MKKIVVVVVALSALSAVEMNALQKAKQKAQAAKLSQAVVVAPKVTPAQPVAPKAPVKPVATETAIVIPQDDMLFNIPEVTDIPDLNRILALANISLNKETIIALKAQAAKIAGSKDYLDLFDHYAQTLPGVITKRAQETKNFNETFKPTMLLAIDELRNRMQSIATATDETQKKQMLAALNASVVQNLRKLEDLYYEVGSGMPALQKAILGLSAKLKNMLSIADTTKKPAESYYQLLGVKADATMADVRKAYRALALKLHPDKSPGNQAKFYAVSEAYAVLSDPKLRAEYDIQNK